MPEENGNGKNGKATGLLERLKSALHEDVQSMKTDLPAKAKRAKEVKGGMDPLRLLASVSVQQAQAKDEPAA